MKKFKYSSKNYKSKENNDHFVTKLLNSGIGQIVLIGVSILMLLSVYRSFKQMGQKISLLKQAEQEVQELRLENLELSLEVEEAGSISRLEKEARDRLNYGQEGEVAFVIGEDLIEIGKQKVQAILTPQEEIAQVNALNEWVDFIVNGY
jgi:cell division protein FtsB